MTAPITPPGWYPDSTTGLQRYWDGAKWLDIPAPAAAAAPHLAPAAARSGRITIHYGFALLAFFSLAGTLLFGIPLMAQAGDEETGGIASSMGILWIAWGGMWTLIWTAFAIHHTLKGR
ncbi:DUF2510 domain-containing protein [Mycolicibacterium diernhoferi]|uniref:DUF2510 domain-containing protein n=1 Tax=Mycolicibacterium diernhoferi TaxID=1801 RepID=A0A1Q4HME7_9MYCO|nr:DUF2510 domain-containing protein [Mycolicibacterium diernhoferi]OJZ68655.1 hypothetical protein BRW64_03590 [Mycolicibacterium diernhoferi]OPE53941.1 hypothetical protein BV510_12895 [Mycolicibacterium diernhoferi]PEG52001.1 DUF2510 domain-containing protein [Mycolicibacterium diernhoferi]QYL20842.1 DUF2510 domain-containing protein [Mycolicibacterium diernhoferi]